VPTLLAEARPRSRGKVRCDLCGHPVPAGVAYPHPGCPLHAPDEVCGCGTPDRCLSPTHGRISMAEALTIRHSQAGRKS
jgi:hypothetical protein